jgi:hypothetical protein
MAPIRWRKTLVNNYHMMPRNIPEERGYHQHCGGSLKSKLSKYMRKGCGDDWCVFGGYDSSKTNVLYVQVFLVVYSERQAALNSRCRWGPNGVTAYKDNMVKLMKLFKNSLPVETLVVWTTVPPISTTCYGPLLVKQVRNM